METLNGCYKAQKMEYLESWPMTSTTMMIDSFLSLCIQTIKSIEMLAQIVARINRGFLCT